MIAALISVLSMVALLQFFFMYCRAVLAYCAAVALSDDVRQLANATGLGPGPDDYARLLQLMRLCPESKMNERQIRAVGVYYRTLRAVDALASTISPATVAWAEAERKQCSHFAAVALEQRISLSRNFCSQGATS